ncbi:MAG: amidophosphoribosyltransferase [Chloroflexota bacterium]|nr:amidophosphoribosyltransferase [Chloroflexota bacterium]
MQEKKLSEKCGVVGIYHPSEQVASSTFFSLFSLQHRGQESAGIATSDGSSIYEHKALGLINQVFDEDKISKLKGNISIGHTRYSTTGSNNFSNSQPIKVSGISGDLFIGHNGNLINTEEIIKILDSWGISTFNTTSDSELIAMLYANSPGLDWKERSQFCMSRLKGAYSIVMLNKDSLICARDPNGFRPLVLGKYREGFIVASETCALDHVGASFIREIEPGETIVIRNNEVISSVMSNNSVKSLCSFEQIYLSRPDSILDGELTYSRRMNMGEILAKEHSVSADLVIDVPDSATAAAVGFANRSGIPYVAGLIKNRYVGRTFISPDQKLRDIGVRIKFNTLNSVISGKRIVLVDDSIVRGTTTPQVIKMLRRAGATEVHVRVASPPIISTCHFGVDTGKLDELIASRLSVEEIRKVIDADSLEFLSVNGLEESMDYKNNYCLGCFTKKYPIPVQLEMDKMKLEEKV